MSWPLIDMEEMIEHGLVKLGRGNVISKLDIAAHPGPYPIYSSAQMNNGKFGEYGKYMFDKELITWSVDGGGQLFYRPKHKFSVTNVAGTLEVLNGTRLDCRYLHYVLSDKHTRLKFDWIRKAHPSVIRRLYKEIPVPPVVDQRRIAHLLVKVEGLITQRKQHLQQLDELLKSVFLEMFGDPVRNDKGWEKKPCSMVAKIITGHPFKSDLYTDDSTQLRLCGGLIIYPQRIEWDKCNYWPTELTHGLEKYLLRSNDIVLAMDRPWISSGLKICTIDTTGIGSLLVQRTACLRATDVDQYFLYAHLKDSSFTRHCKPTETTVPHISIKDIQTFQVLCPPRDLQNQFAAIGEKVESLKSRYQQSLSDLEALYGALSQKAFKGELDLSRVPLPDMSH